MSDIDDDGILVAGTGPAGLIAALAMSRAGFDVTLVGPPASLADGRTTALMSPAIAWLDELGVADRFRDEAAALRVMRIVDATGRLIRSPTVTFHASEIGEDAFGLNIPNRALNAALSNAVLSDPSIEWKRLTVEHWETGPDHVTATLSDGSEIRAALRSRPTAGTRRRGRRRASAPWCAPSPRRRWCWALRTRGRTARSRRSSTRRRDPSRRCPCPATVPASSGW